MTLPCVTLVRDRTGLALPASIVLLLAMTLLAHGLLLLSQGEVRATAALRDVARARAAAETGLQLFWGAAGDSANAGPEGSWFAAGSGGLGHGLEYELFRRSMGAGFFLVRSQGRVGGRVLGEDQLWVGRVGSCGIVKTSNSPEE